MDWFLDFALLPVLKVGVIVFGFVMLAGGLLALFERKQSAWMQRRVGPNRAPGLGSMRLGGVFHMFANGLKLLFKEDSVPQGASRRLHRLAPALALLPALALFAIVPFMDYVCLDGIAKPINGRDYCFPETLGSLANGPIELLTNPLLNPSLGHWFQIADLSAGLLYMFAIIGLGTYGALLAGWVSNSKYSVIGGLRAAAQTISYEIAMVLALAGVFMVYATFDPNTMVRAQGELIRGFFPAWGIILQPVGFVLFMTAAIAVSRRAPFDAPTAPSDIAGGYTSGYNGGKLAAFSLGQFVTIVFIAAIAATIFLGGWQIPWLYADGFHFSATSMSMSGADTGALNAAQAHSAVTMNTNFAPDLALPYAAVVFLRVGGFVAKIVLLCMLQIQVRWSLPRFRYDQIMGLGWKVLLPLGLANLIVTALVLLL